MSHASPEVGTEQTKNFVTVVNRRKKTDLLETEGLKQARLSRTL